VVAWNDSMGSCLRMRITGCGESGAQTQVRGALGRKRLLLRSMAAMGFCD